MPNRKSMLGKGCLDYVRAVYSMEISFPSESVCCDYCDFSHSENAGSRFRCLLTGEILPYHDLVPGARCPLDIPNPQKNKSVEVNEE